MGKGILVSGFFFVSLVWAAAEVPNAPDYVWVQMKDPVIPLKDFRHAQELGDSEFAAGPVRVTSKGQKESVEVSGLELDGHQLKIGSILGSFKVSALSGGSPVTVYTPEIGWDVWHPVFRLVPQTRILPIFDFSNVGIGMVARTPLRITLPPEISFKVREDLTLAVEDRYALQKYLSDRIDLLFSEALSHQRFRFYLIHQPNFLEPAIEKAFDYFKPTIHRYVAERVRAEVLSPEFVDRFLTQLVALLPPIKTDAVGGRLTWKRETEMEGPVWSLVYSRNGGTPSKRVREEWSTLPFTKKGPNMVRLAFTGSALSSMFNDALGNFSNFSKKVSLPPYLTIDVIKRRFLLWPSQKTEEEKLKQFFRVLQPLQALPEAPVLAFHFVAGTPIRFRKAEAEHTSVGARLSTELIEKDSPSKSTPSLELELETLINPDLQIAKLSLGTAGGEPKAAGLAGLGQGFHALFLRSLLNEKIKEAGNELSNLMKLRPLGPENDAEALSVEFLQSLEF